MQNITTEEKRIAWKVLDALQNDIPINTTLVLKDVLARFDLIQELKDKIDVRETQEKLSTESLLSHLQSEKEVKRESMQQFQNRICSILSIRAKHMVSTTEGSL